MSNTHTRSGPTRLRAALNLANNTRNAEQWTAEEWLKLHAAYDASGWDITPDRWSPSQVRGALYDGRAPSFRSHDCAPIDDGDEEERGPLHDRGATLTLDLPAEFCDLCEEIGIAPMEALRGFVADAAGIMNYAANPRIDGYSSNGSDERSMARRYLQRRTGR